MNQDVKQGMVWQSAYYDKFAEILQANAHRLITVRIATPDEDMKQATDFVLELGGGGRVAARVRRDGKFYWDITIRSYSRGHKTELDKLREGGPEVARYYLYCWTDSAKQINKWILWDIDKMRAAGLLGRAWREIPNRDGGQTKFVTVPIRELRDGGCVIGECLPEPRYATIAGQQVLMAYE